MHTVDLVDEALALARRLGYCIREDWLSSGGGVCELRGKKWILLDLGSGADDKLRLVIEALSGDPRVQGMRLSPGLARQLGQRQAA